MAELEYKLDSGPWKTGIFRTVTEVRLILNAAVEKLASGIILVHNHSSGNLSSSDADIAITKKIREARHVLVIKSVLTPLLSKWLSVFWVFHWP